MNDQPHDSPPAPDAELRRRCLLLLDLAEEEVGTRRRAAKDGHDTDAGIRDLETDLDRIRPVVQAVPTMLAILSDAATDWPQFDNDDPVPGSDLVEWFGHWRQRAKACLDGVTSSPGEATPTALQSILATGFVVLTHNAANDGDSRYEAWAYKGPLDFNQAGPIRFGVGADPHQAIDALDWQLQHNPDRATD